MGVIPVLLPVLCGVAILYQGTNVFDNVYLFSGVLVVVVLALGAVLAPSFCGASARYVGIVTLIGSRILHSEYARTPY